MSSAIAPPANNYISLFDFRLVFDLTDGTIKIDLYPSLIISGTGIYVGVQIVRPDKVTFNDPNAFTPATYNLVYSYNLPRVQKVYMWGNYAVTCTITLDNIPYPITKSFNLCAVNTKDPYATEATGVISLSSDCAMGTITARGFCGYVYKGQSPYEETWNLTRFYPPEAELMPQKNLTVLPFTADAYVGVNKVKGVNTSKYDFGDYVYVVLRITGAAEKNIRCDMDMDQIYCGMKSMLDTLAACNGTAKDYVQGFAEVNALLWTATVGRDAGHDVSAEIERLEKLLGVDCRCAACAGDKVCPTCIPECPTVASAIAMVDASGAAIGSTLVKHYEAVTQNGAQWEFTFDGVPQAADTVKVDWQADAASGSYTATGKTTVADICQAIFINIQAAQHFTKDGYDGIRITGTTAASGTLTLTTVTAQDAKLRISYNTGNMSAGTSVNVKIRPFCDPATNEAWIDKGNVAVTGPNTTVTIAYDITDPVTYQIMLTSVMSDGTECDSVVIQAPGICPAVVDINQPPVGPSLTRFTADWGWSNAEFNSGNAVLESNFTQHGSFETGKAIIADFTGAPAGVDYFIVRYPVAEVTRRHWDNQGMNSGDIPDSVFVDTFEDATYKYTWSRVRPALQSSYRKISFSV